MRYEYTVETNLASAPQAADEGSVSVINDKPPEVNIWFRFHITKGLESVTKISIYLVTAIWPII